MFLLREQRLAGEACRALSHCETILLQRSYSSVQMAVRC